MGNAHPPPRDGKSCHAAASHSQSADSRATPIRRYAKPPMRESPQRLSLCEAGCLLGDAGFECLAERLAHRLELDAVEDVLEEAAHDQPLRLLLRETPSHRVEQLLAVDLAQRRP